MKDNNIKLLPLVTSVVSGHVILTDTLQVTAIVPALALREQHSIVTAQLCGEEKWVI